MKFTDDLLKPLLSIPIQIAHLTTSVAIPVPGFRNIANDALQWINPDAYESQEKLRTKISITQFTQEGNVWKWIIGVFVVYMLITKIRKPITQFQV